eukprot:360702-Chlamydomonas_euryale.AAC.5
MRGWRRARRARARLCAETATVAATCAHVGQASCQVGWRKGPGVWGERDTATCTQVVHTWAPHTAHQHKQARWGGTGKRRQLWARKLPIHAHAYVCGRMLGNGGQHGIGDLGYGQGGKKTQGACGTQFDGCTDALVYRCV